MTREWKRYDHDTCPECDSIPEGLTHAKKEGFFEDGDTIRCPECYHKGVILVTATEGLEVIWDCPRNDNTGRLT